MTIRPRECALLEDLRDLGVTAIELLPLADFKGSRNWGYDGVLPYGVGVEIVPGRAEVVVDHVENDHQAEGMRLVDQALISA
jgi:maltooligosyltrehalose trehalohydrolase